MIDAHAKTLFLEVLDLIESLDREAGCGIGYRIQDVREMVSPGAVYCDPEPWRLNVLYAAALYGGGWYFYKPNFGAGEGTWFFGRGYRP